MEKLIHPRFETLPPIPVVGMKMEMDFVTDKTAELFRSFMPQRKNIDAINADIYCIQEFDGPINYSAFDPSKKYIKIAAMAVQDGVAVPENMEGFVIPGGEYLVFTFKGIPADFPEVLRHVFTEYLPQNGYATDHRPHFQLLGEKYKNNDANSEEWVFIPVVKIR